MHQVDYLIIGQGISGSFLSYFLLESGATILVLDNDRNDTPSKVASGMINPVTGRIVATTWMISELMRFAEKTYIHAGRKLHEHFIVEKNILTIPPTLQMQEALEKRVSEKNTFITGLSTVESTLLSKNFNFYYEPKKIQPAYLVNVQAFLQSWKNYLAEHNCLEKSLFDVDALTLKKEGIVYKNIQAKKIIFCNGIETFTYQPWKNLPYTITKGEALIAEIEGLDKSYMYKSGNLTIAPWQNDAWWIGSSFEHQFKDALPSENFRSKKEMELKALLKMPFIITGHLASLRPGCIERKPFVGLHPIIPSLAILNGMGTKGCSLAPYFAKQLSDNLIFGKPIEPMANVERFIKVLSRD